MRVSTEINVEHVGATRREEARAYNKGKLTSKELKVGHGAVMSARCFVDRNIRPSQANPHSGS